MPPWRKYSASIGVSMRTITLNSVVEPSSARATTVSSFGSSPWLRASIPATENCSVPRRASPSAESPL